MVRTVHAFLISNKYEVHGLIRRASTINTKRIEHLYVDHLISDAKLFFHYGDLSDLERIGLESLGEGEKTLNHNINRTSNQVIVK